MPRPSKIDRLPQTVRDFIASARTDGRTIDEIMEAVIAEFELDAASLPARSGFGRHVQGLDRMAEKLNRSRAVADALVRRLGDAPESRQARLNIELMHGIVTDLALAAGDTSAEDGRAVTFDAEQVHFLAKSLDHLARAARSDVQTTLALRHEPAPPPPPNETDAKPGAIDPEAAEEARRILGIGP
jgi:hypothetical protein